MSVVKPVNAQPQAAPAQPAQKALAPMDDFRGALTLMESQFKMALPKQIDPDKFIRVVMTAVQNTPALLNADRHSLFNACMKSAQDGLLPDGREAALVTYRDREKGLIAQYMPMVSGILKKIRNSGELGNIATQVVFKNDKFRFWIDDEGEHIEHEPLLFGDRGDAIAVYALARTKDNHSYIEVLNHRQVMAVKASAKSDKGPWSGSFEHEMWRKTAIRRLSKRLPMSTDLEQVISRDDEMYDFSKNDGENDKGKKLEKMIGVQHEEAQIVPPATEAPKAAAPAAEPGPFNDFDGGAV